MPNLSKNAEIAQYFAHAYRSPENGGLAMKDEVLMKKVAEGDMQSLAETIQKMQSNFEDCLKCNEDFHGARVHLKSMNLSPT